MMDLVTISAVMSLILSIGAVKLIKSTLIFFGPATDAEDEPLSGMFEFLFTISEGCFQFVGFRKKSAGIEEEDEFGFLMKAKKKSKN